MIRALLSLNILHVVVVSMAGFALGSVWYSPFLFAKAWLREMRIDPADARAAGGGLTLLVSAFVLTLVSTAGLAALISVAGPRTAGAGARFGLLVGLLLVAARQGVNGVFERRSLRHFLITAGHDVALCALQGALLGAWA